MNARGEIDLPDSVLERLDIAIASIHMPCFKDERTIDNITAAYEKVMEHPYVDIIGHPDDGRFPVDMKRLVKKAKETGEEIQVFQSNHEGAIIDRIQEAYSDGTEGIVINPGAYTHYSYAIRDALASVDIPKVEIHISDITSREEFRKISVTAPVCNRQIYGQGLDGYLQAIDFLRENRQ